MNIRMKLGFERMFSKKILLNIPVFITLIVVGLTYWGEGLLRKMGSPYSSDLYVCIYYAVMVAIWFVAILGIISLMGTPLKSAKVEGALMDIDFTDKDGNPPVLVAARKENKGLVYEFYSPKITFVKYEDHVPEIETALNIKVVSVEPGKDTRNVIIKAIKSGTKNNEMIRWNDGYLSSKDFELVLGESFAGVEVIDISTTPHVLIGGGSGSGKSKLLKSVLMQSIKKGAIVYLADFKGGLDYPAVWHENCDIITEKEMLDEKLSRILNIMEERKMMLVEAGTPNIAEYNEKMNSNICRIIVACDEIAEVLDKTGLDKDEKAIVSQIESKFSTIARLGRAFGIHLILATQRPDADILKGQIKNNIGYRICGRADKVLSQIILDNSEGAEKISPNDQGMFYTNTRVLFKAYYVEDDCLEGVNGNGEAGD